MKRTRLLLIFVSLLLFSDSLYSQLWKNYADRAKFYTDQKNDDKAFEFYDKETVQLKKDSAGTDSYAKMAIYVANLYTQKKQFDKSESLYLDAKKINETLHGKESSAYAESCNELAKLYFLVHKYDKAIELFAEVRSIANNTGAKNIEYVRSSINLATIYNITNETEKAEALYIEAMQLIEQIAGKTHPFYSAIEDMLGTIYAVEGWYEKAEPLFLEERQIRGKNPGKETAEYASSCNSLATLYTDMGEYDKAIKLCIEAKNLREKIFSKGNPDYVSSCGNLARLYDLMGNYEKAESLYLEAKKILEKDKGNESSLYAMFCNNLAALYDEMGLYEKALPLDFKAKQIRAMNSGKESADYAQSCNNIGGVYTNMEQYEKAEPYYLEAKQIREKLFTKDNPFYASTCSNLAILYDRMNQYKKAESLYLEAKQIREKILGKDHPDYAKTVNDLAGLYYQTGQFKKAESLYLESKQIREKILGKEHPAYVRSCLNLANVYSAENEFENADKLYAETFEVQNIQLKKVFEFSSESEKQTYIHTMPDFENYFFSFLTSSFQQNPDLSYNIALFRRNLILSSLEQLRQSIYQTNDTILRNKYDAWMGGRETIAFWNSKPVSQRPSYLQHIEDSTENLEKDIARMSSTFKNQNNERQIKSKDIQQQLKPGEASIEFLDFQDNKYNNINKFTDSTFYIALLLRKDKPEPELIRLFEKKQLDSILNKKGNGEDENINSLYTYSKNNLSDKSIYNLIWKPLEKSLKGITKIYFAPSGDLYKIAFAALPVDKNKVLSDKYQLVELNTTASVTDQFPSFINTTDTIQLYGGIQYDADSTALKQVVNLYASNKDNIASRSIPDDLDRGSKFNYLPGTETEIENIKQQSATANIYVKILSGINATEESFKALNGEASPAVIHIATHGFFFPDPKEEKDKSLAKLESGRVFRQSDNPLFRSGLAFAGANYAWSGKPIDGIDDGILTAYDVSNMYLPNTKLVVLSACETALGEIEGSEGVYGLQRAFKIAGVKNLVMSLWKVPDQATAEFMKAFYKNIFAKQSISDAFYHAQTTMKNKYRDEPYMWAAWILVR